MIAFLFSRAGAALTGVLALAALLAYSHVSAYQAGRTAERTASLTRSVEILRERSKTDEAVRGMSPERICLELGGLPDECASIGM